MFQFFFYLFIFFLSRARWNALATITAIALVKLFLLAIDKLAFLV